MPELDPKLAETNLEAVEVFLSVLDGVRMGAGLSYYELGHLVGCDADTMELALHRGIDITLSDLMTIALALDVKLALGIYIPDLEETPETSSERLERLRVTAVESKKALTAELKARCDGPHEPKNHHDGVRAWCTVCRMTVDGVLADEVRESVRRNNEKMRKKAKR